MRQEQARKPLHIERIQLELIPRAGDALHGPSTAIHQIRLALRDNHQAGLITRRVQIRCSCSQQDEFSRHGLASIPHTVCECTLPDYASNLFLCPYFLDISDTYAAVILLFFNVAVLWWLLESIHMETL